MSGNPIRTVGILAAERVGPALARQAAGTCEPALELVQLGRTGGREVQTIPRSPIAIACQQIDTPSEFGQDLAFRTAISCCIRLTLNTNSEIHSTQKMVKRVHESHIDDV